MNGVSMPAVANTNNNAHSSQGRINWYIVLMTLSMFMTGASGMVVEYVLSTVSSYLNGSSIESFSLTIAIMMGMMGIGGWAQRFVSDENIIDKFVYLELTLAIVSAFSPIAVYAAFSYLPDHYQLVYYFFVMSIGFMVGFEIPFITRANASFTRKLSDNLSIVFTADYVGAFIGALIWVYFLLPHMNIIQIGFVLSALNFCVAIMTYVYFRRHTLFSQCKKVLFCMFLVATALLMGFNKVPEWATVVEQKMYPDPIVVSKKTPYQNLTLTHNALNNDTRLYINGSTQFSSIDEVRYHEALIHIPAGTLETPPKRALVLGGGDGMATRELKKYQGIEIDLIELDRDMFKWSMTQSHLTKLNNNAFADFKEVEINDYPAVRSALRDFRSDGGHRVFYTDANNFINAYVQNQIPPRYDIIVIDLPDPYNLAINKMYTLQFYNRLNALLNEEGVIVSQSTSPFHSPKVFATIGKTMRAAGYYATPYHHNIPSFGEWGWYMASKLPKAFNSLQVETEYFTDELAKASFLFGKNELIDDDTLEVNSLMRPVVVRLYTKESWIVE